MNDKYLYVLTIVLLMLLISAGAAEQINIRRVERMPNMPEPYLMRDWKQVTMGYDSLVFDLNQTGEYLPLIHLNSSSVNYPAHSSFVLHTVVGTPNRNAGEAINILPAVIGASLAGIDKSNQNGYNWVLMCEDFFNRRLQENVYLNNPVGKSGTDWWYDTMPNVFFYQLYDLYPHTGDFDFQFLSVADRWLEAVREMGGHTAPWKRPYMNYRAWSFSTMEPLDAGVRQPEAAGAIGWLLYNAYIRTGDDKYRIGAEWCMEFLHHWTSNPSYELQLPYGVYTAARMNAELGTQYDVEKMVNWCFDANDNVRNWGATLGRWGDYDCYGLIGEAKYAGYAFIMNGFEMAGALVPMVRYDDRFARAIGKWMLNLANATRLFYPNYLPDNHQDGREWSKQYDPKAYIAHEAMRQYEMSSGISPYATGDFVRNGWAATNLALYGSSHVGIFGGIIDTTSVKRILKLNLNKTDYFRDKACPSFLLFNPYDSEQTVQLEVGTGPVDVYDAVSNAFIAYGASGTAAIAIPADNAVVAVLVPADGTVAYEYNRMLVDGVVVDYNAGQVVANYPPRIKSLAAPAGVVTIGSTMPIFCTAEDRDQETLVYQWLVDDSLMAETGETLSWQAPAETGMHHIQCVVHDGGGLADTAMAIIQVVEYVNMPPVIDAIEAAAQRTDVGVELALVCHAHDVDGDRLEYQWRVPAGSIAGTDSTAVWTTPLTPGYYFVACTVTDGRGGSDADSTGIIVLDLKHIGTGLPVAYYPFNGNADDESGFGHHATFYGTKLVVDRFGNPGQAYYFDGVDDYMKVTNQPDLNFRDEISVSLWMNVEQFANHEMYPISHGNWENRWKISISPNTHTIRWTVKTEDGIRDLDSKTALAAGAFYNVTATYDGAEVRIYVNGILDNQGPFSGKLLTTDIDLTIGRVLPSNTCCNFQGVLDDIRIYSYALSDEEIRNIYEENTAVENEPAVISRDFRLWQNYPNPFNLSTVIRYQLARVQTVSLVIYNTAGQQIRSLVQAEQPAGLHRVAWDGLNDAGDTVSSGVYLYRLNAGAQIVTHKLLLLK